MNGAKPCVVQTAVLPIAYAILFCISDCTTKLPQSILYPGGDQARRIEGIWWEMFIVYGAVFIITMGLLISALLARKQQRSILGSRFVIIAGIIIPTVILVIMLFADIRVHKHIAGHAADFQVQVIGHGWWFEVRYPGLDLVDANEIHVPAGSTVGFELSSAHMAHSFWIPRLGGKRDQLPDHPNELHLQINNAGVFEGVCTEFCAGQHAKMGFRLVAHKPDEFREWLNERRQVRRAPTDSLRTRGGLVFINAGCAACHPVIGLSNANIGPDLSFVGARLTLGAGEFQNSRGLMAGWVANSQALKPVNEMPRTYLAPEDLLSLLEFLWSLR